MILCETTSILWILLFIQISESSEPEKIPLNPNRVDSLVDVKKVIKRYNSEHDHPRDTGYEVVPNTLRDHYLIAQPEQHIFITFNMSRTTRFQTKEMRTCNAEYSAANSRTFSMSCSLPDCYDKEQPVLDELLSLSAILKEYIVSRDKSMENYTVINVNLYEQKLLKFNEAFSGRNTLMSFTIGSLENMELRQYLVTFNLCEDEPGDFKMIKNRTFRIGDKPEKCLTQPSYCPDSIFRREIFEIMYWAIEKFNKNQLDYRLHRMVAYYHESTEYFLGETMRFHKADFYSVEFVIFMDLPMSNSPYGFRLTRSQLCFAEAYLLYGRDQYYSPELECEELI